MYDIILSFITAFLLVYLAIPSIINIAKVKHLYDVPDHRKSHDEVVPTLGGVAIFAGVIFSIILWTPFEVFGDLQYILCSFIIIFLIGKTIIQKNRQSSVSLYVKALKDENSGNLEGALANYKSAYEEAAKTRFQENMKERILNKMKVLHSMKGYNKQFQLTEN